jgi:hypothetical protein
MKRDCMDTKRMSAGAHAVRELLRGRPFAHWVRSYRSGTIYL